MRKITAKQAAHVPTLATKKKPRGVPGAPQLRKYAFKKGHDPRRNPGGKPRVLVRFSAAIAEELMRPAERAVVKELGLKGKPTNFQVMITSAVRQGIFDWSAMLGLRDVVEGKLPNRNINVSANMQKLLEDPEFKEFVDQQLELFLARQQGAVINGAIEPRTNGKPLPAIEGE